MAHNQIQFNSINSLQLNLMTRNIKASETSAFSQITTDSVFESVPIHFVRFSSFITLSFLF